MPRTRELTYYQHLSNQRAQRGEKFDFGYVSARSKKQQKRFFVVFQYTQNKESFGCMATEKNKGLRPQQS